MAFLIVCRMGLFVRTFVFQHSFFFLLLFYYFFCFYFSWMFQLLYEVSSKAIWARNKKKNKSSKDKSKEQNRRKLVYPVIKNHYACNSIQSKRRVRETISKSARNEEEEKNGRHFTFTTVRFCFFFFFNGYSCNFICMYSSISFIVLVAIYSRQHSLCVFFSAFISLCVSVGLL